MDTTYQIEIYSNGHWVEHRTHQNLGWLEITFDTLRKESPGKKLRLVKITREILKETR